MNRFFTYLAGGIVIGSLLLSCNNKNSENIENSNKNSNLEQNINDLHSKNVTPTKAIDYLDELICDSLKLAANKKYDKISEVLNNKKYDVYLSNRETNSQNKVFYDFFKDAKIKILERAKFEKKQKAPSFDFENKAISALDEILWYSQQFVCKEDYKMAITFLRSPAFNKYLVNLKYKSDFKDEFNYFNQIRKIFVNKITYQKDN